VRLACSWRAPVSLLQCPCLLNPSTIQWSAWNSRTVAEKCQEHFGFRQRMRRRRSTPPMEQRPDILGHSQSRCILYVHIEPFGSSTSRAHCPISTEMFDWLPICVSKLILVDVLRFVLRGDWNFVRAGENVQWYVTLVRKRTRFSFQRERERFLNGDTVHPQSGFIVSFVSPHPRCSAAAISCCCCCWPAAIVPTF
jgi:hypothetical protein